MEGLGYSSCSNLPSSGVELFTGTSGDWELTFETAEFTVPSGWTNGGEIFEKRIESKIDGVSVFSMEFNCDDTAAWARLTEPNVENPREVEVYFDLTTDSEKKLEIYAYETPQDGTIDKQYYMAKFESTSETAYNFWVTRAVDGVSSDDAIRVAILGDSNTGAAAVFMERQADLDNSNTDLEGSDNYQSGGDLECIDFSNRTSISNGTCSSYELSSAGVPLLDETSGSFSIEWIADEETGLVSRMRSISRTSE